MGSELSVMLLATENIRYFSLSDAFGIFLQMFMCVNAI